MHPFGSKLNILFRSLMKWDNPESKLTMKVAINSKEIKHKLFFVNEEAYLGKKTLTTQYLIYESA